MVLFEYCLNCMVNMLILAHSICLSWNPCNNYIVIKASVFYTTKPINPVICLMMNLYIASFPYHKALSWLMELKFSSQKSMSITCAIFNSNKACIYFLGAKTLQICILYIQISTTPISFHIETSLINSIKISDIYIRIKRLYLTLINFPQSGILYIHFGFILEAVAFQLFINRDIWTLFVDAMLMFRLQIPMNDVQ